MKRVTKVTPKQAESLQQYRATITQYAQLLLDEIGRVEVSKTDEQFIANDYLFGEIDDSIESIRNKVHKLEQFVNPKHKKPA